MDVAQDKTFNEVLVRDIPSIMFHSPRLKSTRTWNTLKFNVSYIMEPTFYALICYVYLVYMLKLSVQTKQIQEENCKETVWNFIMKFLFLHCFTTGRGSEIAAVKVEETK